MSTRSRIGIQNSDRSIDSIYCHHDGYPSYNGDVLIRCYSDEAKLRELISYGNTSGIEETLEASKEASYANSGEDLIVMHSDLETFLKYREEYGYLFKDGKWFIDFGKGLVELTKEIIEND